MKRILIVDDEEEVLELLKTKFEKNNYSVRTALTGEEALIKCKTYRPDLVLLDIAMPVMDGYEVCKKIKGDEDTKDIPVFFLTAKDLQPEGIIERYKELGACGYLPKPSTFQELLAKTKEILGE